MSDKLNEIVQQKERLFLESLDKNISLPFTSEIFSDGKKSMLLYSHTSGGASINIKISLNNQRVPSVDMNVSVNLVSQETGVEQNYTSATSYSIQSQDNMNRVLNIINSLELYPNDPDAIPGHFENPLLTVLSDLRDVAYSAGADVKVFGENEDRPVFFATNTKFFSKIEWHYKVKAPLELGVRGVDIPAPSNTYILRMSHPIRVGSSQITDQDIEFNLMDRAGRNIFQYIRCIKINDDDYTYNTPLLNFTSIVSPDDFVDYENDGHSFGTVMTMLENSGYENKTNRYFIANDKENNLVCNFIYTYPERADINLAIDGRDGDFKIYIRGRFVTFEELENHLVEDNELVRNVDTLIGFLPKR